MAEPGVCSIKAEYILTKPMPSEDNFKNQEESSKDQLDTSSNDEPSAKKYKSDDMQTKSRKKKKGQNKVRPKTFREENGVVPCPTIIDIRDGNVPSTCNFTNCQYVHDASQYLSSKPNDIGTECHVFKLRGHCPRGLSCRFGTAHLTADGKNIVNDDAVKNWKEDTINCLPQKMFNDLQKRKYDFGPYENLVRKLDQRNINKNLKSDINEMATVVNGTDESKKSVYGPITDEDIIKLLPREKKAIDWKDKLYLAPLTTVGNLPFRRICKSYGADITCGEMALCESLLKGMKQEWALLKRHSTEDMFGVQICGNNAFTITKVAHLIRENHQVDFVDLNLGCPIELIYQKGGGCGMLHRLPALEASIRCASQVLHVPFTVKTRTGVYQDKKIAHNLVSKFYNWGASMITVHGRSREARYSRLADWDYIETCTQAAAPCPVFGSGDILSYQDYVDKRNLAPSVQGVMIGRGALIKPWIFTEIKEQKLWDISSSERFDILKKYTNYGLEHWGSDTRGVENTRRFLLEWLSFLYRYIPVGLLEQPPQKINQRPPLYVGRDDMETLMASGNCADWINISEKLLGPVPDGFQFLPKHKANSFK